MHADSWAHGDIVTAISSTCACPDSCEIWCFCKVKSLKGPERSINLATNVLNVNTACKQPPYDAIETVNVHSIWKSNDQWGTPVTRPADQWCKFIAQSHARSTYTVCTYTCTVVQYLGWPKYCNDEGSMIDVQIYCTESISALIMTSMGHARRMSSS